jgi:hypothetical protein
VQVAPLPDGQTENRGVIAAVTLALAVTVMPVAGPPEGQTQIAKVAVPPGWTEVVMACTLTHSRTAGELAVGDGVGFLDAVGVGVAVLEGLAEGVGLAGGALLLGALVGLAVGVAVVGAAAGVLAAVLAVLVAVGVAAASRTADTESSCTSAALTATELIAAAGCAPHVFTAAVVYANCAGCVPARNALTRPEEMIEVPANTVSANAPARRTLMMAPSSSWSSRRDLACSHAVTHRLRASSIPS